MKQELTMIENNQTWKLVKRPKHRIVLVVKSIFRTKLNADVFSKKHKSKLVVKGYTQIFCINFSNTFGPVARSETTILLLAIALQNGWKVFQFNVKSPFLYIW